MAEAPVSFRDTVNEPAINADYLPVTDPTALVGAAVGLAVALGVAAIDQPLVGAAMGQGEAVAAFEVAGDQSLSGSASGTGSASGNATLVGDQALSGAATGAGEASGSASINQQLSGSAAGAGTASGDATIGTVGFTGNVVFTGIGQSNWEGQATPDAGADWPAGTQEYNIDTDTWQTPASRELWMGDMGLQLQFTIDFVAANPGATVYWVTDGYFAQPISNMYKGTDNYNRVVNAVNAQLPLISGGAVLGGVLFHQGESDRAAGNNVFYEDRLDQLILDLRADLDAADSTTPFVLGGMTADSGIVGDTATPTITSIHTATPDRNLYAGFASTLSPTAINGASGDTIHFDAAGFRTLGERYHDAFVAARSNTTYPAPVAAGTVPTQETLENSRANISAPVASGTTPTQTDTRI